jgi:Caspase domain
LFDPQVERGRRVALLRGPELRRDRRYSRHSGQHSYQLFLDANIDSRLLVSFDAATRELHPRAAADGAATRENFEREMAAVQARIRASAARGLSTEFYFFFSGHGDVEGGEGRLILEDHALTRADLYELLESSGASVNHVFLDACSSFLVASKRADVQRRRHVDPAFALRQTPDQLGNVGFVLSSSSDRESHEWERFEAGIVSHELRSGLRGAADANLDGRISYAELAAFMHQANRAIDIPRLRPDPFLQPPGRKDWDQPVFSWQSGTVSGGFRVAPWAISLFLRLDARY